MAYASYLANKPDHAVDDGTDFGTYTRRNLLAVRDALIMAGLFYGWPMAATGGTADKPATITYSSGTERVRASITWGTTGGEDGNPTVIVYAYSSNSGSAYDTIGTKTITYDGDGNVTATAWS